MKEWHPLLELTEPQPGVWELREQFGRLYGRIEIRTTPDGPRYRCEFNGTLIGWGTSLRTATERTHQAFIRSHGPQGGSRSDHGTST